MPTSSFATTSVTKVRHAPAPATKPDATKMPAAGMAYRAQRTSTHRAIVTPPVHSQEVKSGKRRLGPSPSQQESPPKPPPAVGRLKRPTQEAHATVTHLRGAAAAIGYATPRTARGAAALAAKAKLKMRARFIEESAGPRPASAHQPIRPKPFATNTPRPATAPSPHFSRKHLPSPRVAAGLPSRRKFRPPIEKGQVQPAAAMPHYSSGVPPGGASSLDVLHPEPISPLSPHRFTKMARHVQSAARVDHEPIAFGDVGKAAVKRQQTGRRSASPPKITSPRPSMRRQSSNLDLLNKQPARAAVKPRDSCPFDVSYAKSPFIRGPPTARGPVRMKPRPGGPVGLSERPF